MNGAFGSFSSVANNSHTAPGKVPKMFSTTH